MKVVPHSHLSIWSLAHINDICCECNNDDLHKFLLYWKIKLYVFLFKLNNLCKAKIADNSGLYVSSSNLKRIHNVGGRVNISFGSHTESWIRFFGLITPPSLFQQHFPLTVVGDFQTLSGYVGMPLFKKNGRNEKKHVCLL